MRLGFGSAGFFPKLSRLGHPRRCNPTTNHPRLAAEPMVPNWHPDGTDGVNHLHLWPLGRSASMAATIYARVTELYIDANLFIPSTRSLSLETRRTNPRFNLKRVRERFRQRCSESRCGETSRSFPPIGVKQSSPCVTFRPRYTHGSRPQMHQIALPNSGRRAPPTRKLNSGHIIKPHTRFMTSPEDPMSGSCLSWSRSWRC